MLKKINIPDLTFLILVRLDSIDRLENTLAITEYLISNLRVKISVCETAAYNNGFLKKLLPKNIHYTFQYDQDPILFRTKFLNQMTQLVSTPFVSIWDSDVIIPMEQIVKAILLLRNNEADFVYPYEKLFLDTSFILRKIFLFEKSVHFLEKNMKKMKEMYLPDPLGGAFLARLDKYKESGLENENFYGWGMEDGERFYRWENLGYRIRRIPGPLFHLSHGRGINSTFHNNDQPIIKGREVLRTVRNVDSIAIGSNIN